jgi:exodeoxyribonuclease VII large subunit
MRLISAEERLNELIRSGLRDKRHLLDIKIERMDALSPLRRLSSGYAFAEDGNGRPLTSIDAIGKGDEVRLYFRDGRAGAVITETEKNTPADPAPY